MSWRLTCIPAACLAAIVSLATSLSAQNRFQIISQDDAGGLRITVVRDTQLSSCFAVFSMESAVPPAVAEVVPPPGPAELARQDAILRIRDAAATRDQQLYDLNTEFERRAGRSYNSLTSLNNTYAVDPVLLGAYQQNLQKINEQYENTLRSVVPGTMPWAAAVPGMRTGGLEDAAGVMNLALLNPDPSGTARTLSNQIAQIDDALRRLNAAPRLAASGPFPCANTEAPRRTEPPKRR
jgi:hypothetical protein